MFYNYDNSMWQHWVDLASCLLACLYTLFLKSTCIKFTLMKSQNGWALEQGRNYSVLAQMLLILEIVAAIFVLVVLLCLQTLSRGYRKPGCTRPPLVTRFSVLPQALLASYGHSCRSLSQFSWSTLLRNRIRSACEECACSWWWDRSEKCRSIQHI